MLLFQEKQAEMLEKLTTLILCVSELKDEVKSLKEGIPKLQEQVREELRGKLESRRMSPLHRATRRKRTVIPREEHLSTGEAESEGGFAIMCGYMSEYESVQNRIKNGYLFKDHLDKAIELKPQDLLSYYLLGRWCYVVSQLSWIERKVAATLFGNPPTATIQDALHYFHKVEEIRPCYSKFNYVCLAKCYKDLGQTVHALKWCDAASAMAVASNEDKEAQKELDSILSSLSQ